jgi:ABC-type branched-subunit amino acid transport system permease subunit
MDFVIASLAFGYLAQYVIFSDWMGTTVHAKGRIDRPSYIFRDNQLYYVILAGLVLTAAACYLIRRSNIGTKLSAMRDSETAFWTLGHSPAVYKLFTVCLSGAIATLAGAFYALLQVRVQSVYYQPGLAILFFGFALAGGMGSIGGAIGAGLFFGALPKYLETLTKSRVIHYDFLFYGLSALVLIAWVKGGLAGLTSRLWARMEGQATP